MWWMLKCMFRLPPEGDALIQVISPKFNYSWMMWWWTLPYKSVRPTRLFITSTIYGECVAAGRDEPVKARGYGYDCWLQSHTVIATVFHFGAVCLKQHFKCEESINWSKWSSIVCIISYLNLTCEMWSHIASLYKYFHIVLHLNSPGQLINSSLFCPVHFTSYICVCVSMCLCVFICLYLAVFLMNRIIYGGGRMGSLFKTGRVPP